jgi:hypothetical protein
MGVVSTAEAGQPESGQEILPEGRPMAASAADRDGIRPEASSDKGLFANVGHAAPAWGDRRLRLVSSQVHVRQVRVTREVSTRAVLTGAPEFGLDGPRVSAPHPGKLRMPAAPPGGQRADARSLRAERASEERVAVPGASVRRASLQRASLQRAGAERVSVRRSGVRPGRLRLTRRGRRVLTGFVMLAIVISAMLIWTGAAGGAQAPGPGAPARSVYAGMTQIVVQPGQTLWSIAAEVDPSVDPWTAVQQISDANALNGAQIQAGQLLWVPRG